MLTIRHLDDTRIVFHELASHKEIMQVQDKSKQLAPKRQVKLSILKVNNNAADVAEKTFVSVPSHTSRGLPLVWSTLQSFQNTTTIT